MSIMATEQVNTTVILAVTEPEKPAMLVGSRGAVPAMTRGLLVHPEQATEASTSRRALRRS